MKNIFFHNSFKKSSKKNKTKFLCQNLGGGMTPDIFKLPQSTFNSKKTQFDIPVILL